LGLEFRVSRIQGSGFGVWGLSLGFRDLLGVLETLVAPIDRSGFGFRVSGSGFRVSGLGIYSVCWKPE
jgi:hypothetical protein